MTNMKNYKSGATTISVDYGYDVHSVSFSQRTYRRIISGKPLVLKGQGFFVEGEKEEDTWFFSEGGKPGSLEVVGEGGREIYRGILNDASIIHHPTLNDRDAYVEREFLKKIKGSESESSSMVASPDMSSTSGRYERVGDHVIKNEKNEWDRYGIDPPDLDFGKAMRFKKLSDNSFKRYQYKLAGSDQYMNTDEIAEALLHVDGIDEKLTSIGWVEVLSSIIKKRDEIKKYEVQRLEKEQSGIENQLKEFDKYYKDWMSSEENRKKNDSIEKAAWAYCIEKSGYEEMNGEEDVRSYRGITQAARSISYHYRKQKGF